MTTRWRRVSPWPLAAIVAGCGFATDPATRLGFDIKAGVDRLGDGQGARFVVEHATPSYRGQCEGPYSVQLDRVGAIIVWCRDEAGDTVSSHSTSHHRRFVDTPRTYLVEKPAGSTLFIELERDGARARIVSVR